MHRFLASTALLVLATVLLGGLRIDPPVKPTMVLTGSESRILEPLFLKITSQEQLEAIWLKHLGKVGDDRWKGPLAIFEVDFSHNLVVAIFQGKSTNSRGLQVEGIMELEHTVHLRYDDLSFQTFGGVADVSVYAFVVLPRTTKVIVVEENVQGLKDKPAEWKERAAGMTARTRM